MNNQTHDDLINQFMQKCKREQPEKFKEVCEKYQTIDNRKWRKIKDRERCAGLLGLQPSPLRSDIALSVRMESSLNGDQD
jgi:hypothetical protein